MGIQHEVTNRLRERIVGALHLGRIHTGDRLPSIRAVAAEMEVNPRTAAGAYRTLEEEGLVEVRGRSGVFVANQERLAGEMLPETARWMAEVLVEARRRRLKIPELHDFMRRCTTLVRVHCGLVESVIDPMVGFAGELEEEWGFSVERVYLHLPGGPELERLAEHRLAALRDQFEEVDLLTTSSFHASVLRPVAEELEKPLVILHLHPQARELIQQHLNEEGRLTVVALDPRLRERIRQTFGDERIRLVPADEVQEVAKLDPTEPVFITPAAREKLGDVDHPRVLPLSPVIAPESDRELAEVLIRANRQAW